MSDNSVLFIGGTIHTMHEGPQPEAVRVDGDRITVTYECSFTTPDGDSKQG